MELRKVKELMGMATNRGRRRNLLLFLLAALLILVLTAGGCGWRQQEGLPEENGSKEGEGEQSAAGDDDMVRVTLYFADEQAENLVAEEREVEEDRLPAAIVEELIKGSETGLGRTIPEGTRVLSVEVKEGVAYVDFSREFKDNHWGGSAGELMTVYSVVNSLARLEEVDKVQFLLEGEVQEELLGHMYYGEPIEPDWDLVEEYRE
jgi:germination protein M